jgi:hypothetical protein
MRQPYWKDADWTRWTLQFPDSRFSLFGRSSNENSKSGARCGTIRALACFHAGTLAHALVQPLLSIRHGRYMGHADIRHGGHAIG